MSFIELVLNAEVVLLDVRRALVGVLRAPRDGRSQRVRIQQARSDSRLAAGKSAPKPLLPRPVTPVCSRLSTRNGGLNPSSPSRPCRTVWRVKDTVCAANDPAGIRRVSKAESRRQVVAVGMNQGSIEDVRRPWRTSSSRSPDRNWRTGYPFREAGSRYS